ncbi:hypothetical protein JdFRA1000001_12c [uncultured archaeal virus]|jgi:hypothetical protein|uniref:Uncharacterized protein n=1 Tax=uncultured archaeal virus TaxID=1960247 RepID=A0A1S5Y2V2_9VIRU|nr:hypothetical protein JdFRA1000001_12c [uncultured archaeal virus]
MSFVPYESVDYTYVINKALLRISERRSNIDSSMKFKFRNSLWEYLRSVEALFVILTPNIRPKNHRTKMEEAKNMIIKENLDKAMEILDELVEEALISLSREGLLLRGEVIRTIR